MRSPCTVAALTGLLLIVGCATPPPAPRSPDSIQIEKVPPPAAAQSLGKLTAVDGAGCGLFGTTGTYERAFNNLHEQARATGADYVQITKVEEPYVDRECAHKTYTLHGTAYRVHPRSSPPPASAVSVASAASVASVTPSATTTPTSGLFVGPSGCAFRAASAESGRSLTFSGRLAAARGFKLWIDAPGPDGSGLELRYEPVSHRLELVRQPGGGVVSVAEQPLELDANFHAWQLVRASDRVVVSLDGKVVLLHALTAGGELGFRLEGDSFEIRELVATPDVRPR